MTANRMGTQNEIARRDGSFAFEGETSAFHIEIIGEHSLMMVVARFVGVIHTADESDGDGVYHR